MYIALFLLSFSLSFSQTISIEPDSIYTEINAGSDTTLTLRISNSGTDTLHWASTSEDLRLLNLVKEKHNIQDYRGIEHQRSTDIQNDLAAQAYTEKQHFRGYREDLELVALVQNSYPFGVTSWENELYSHGISYDILSTSYLLTMDYNDYDMIIITGNQYSSYVFDAYDLIIDYVDSGGIAVVSLCDAPEGSFGSIVSNTSNSYDTYVIDDSHPLMNNLPNYWDTYNYTNSLNRIVSFGEEWTPITQDEYGYATSLIYNDRLFLHTMSLEVQYYYGDYGYYILENTLSWAFDLEEINSWFSTDILSGYIPPNSYQDISITHSADNLNAGNYFTDLIITSNDTINYSITVPNHMRVNGDSELIFSPSGSYDVSLTNQWSGYGEDVEFTFDTDPILAGIDGRIDVTVYGDYDSPDIEWADVFIEGDYYGRLPGLNDYVIYDIDCTHNASFYIDDIVLQNYLQDGQIDVVLQNTYDVNQGSCDSQSSGYEVNTVNLIFNNNGATDNTLLVNPVYIGSQSETLSYISNALAATDTLHIYNVILNSDVFSVDLSPTAIPVGETLPYTLNFHPISAEEFSDSLIIESNDPLSPHILTLTGTGLTPPSIDINPTAINMALLEGEIDSTALTFTNNSDSTIYWQIELSSEELRNLASEYFSDITRTGELEIDGKTIPTFTDTERELFSQKLAAYQQEKIENYRGRDYYQIAVAGNYSYDLIDQFLYGSGAYLFDDMIFTQVSTGSYTYSQVEDYDLLIIAESSSLTTTEENTINQFFQSGKPVLHGSDYDDYYNINSTFGLQSRNYGSYYDSNLIVSEHPIMENVDYLQFWDYTSYYYSSLMNGAECLFSTTDYSGCWGVAYDNEISKSVLFAQEIYFLQHASYAGADGPTLIYNTINWLLDTYTTSLNGVSVYENSGSISPNQSIDLNVTFDATNLLGGTYNTDILIHTSHDSNTDFTDDNMYDPYTSSYSFYTFTVPTTLDVEGIPNITLNTDYIDFGDSFLETVRTDSIMVGNSGTDVLSITGIDLSVGSSGFSTFMGSTSIAPGDSSALIVNFSPNISGIYTTVITINSNDPGSPQLINVTGEGLTAPDLELSVDSIEEFILAGDTSDVSFTVCNEGDADLDWYLSGDGDSGIYDNSFWIDILTTNMWLIMSSYCGDPAWGSTLYYQFYEDGSFYIHDYEEWGAYSLDGNTLNLITLDHNLSFSGTMTENSITGTGYNWYYFGSSENICFSGYLQEYDHNDSSENTQRYSNTQNHTDNQLTIKNRRFSDGNLPSEKKHRGNRDSGGPDNYGYTWLDSDEIGGPNFEWMDISYIGDYLTCCSNGEYYDYNLPFTFNFYGNTYSTINISSEGYIGLGYDYQNFGDYYNTPLPYSYSPNNIIALLWDNLYVSDGVYAYYDSPNNRFIIEWGYVQFNYDASWNFDMQIHLHENGDIYFYYNNFDFEGAYWNEFTVGIENEDGTDGLQIEYSDMYNYSTVLDSYNKAIRISTNQYQGGSDITDWLFVDKTSGLLSQGECDTINVDFNAIDMYGGNYIASLDFFNNDVPNDTANVSILFDVTGFPTIEVAQDSLDFKEHYIGFSDTLSIEYTNLGTDSLILNNFNFSSTAFTLSEATSITECEINGVCNLEVIFTPTEVLDYLDTMEFATNDAANPIYLINLIGEGNSPSDIAINPETMIGDTLEFNLTIGGIDSTTSFSILNEGVDTLEYQIVTHRISERSNSERFIPLVLGNHWGYEEYEFCSNHYGNMETEYICETESEHIEFIGTEQYNGSNYYIVDYFSAEFDFNNSFFSYNPNEQRKFDSSDIETNESRDWSYGWQGLKQTENGDLVRAYYAIDYISGEEFYFEEFMLPFEPSVGDTWTVEYPDNDGDDEFNTFTVIDYLDTFTATNPENGFDIATYEDIWVLKVEEFDDGVNWTTETYYFKRGIGYVYKIEHDYPYASSNIFDVMLTDDIEILIYYDITTDNFIQNFTEFNLTNGNILPGENDDIVMTVNPEDLIGGEHSLEVSITSNDPDEDPLNFFINLDYTAPEYKPQILEIIDVPNDQGDFVRLNIMATVYDEQEDAQYTVWREFQDESNWEILGSFDGVGDTTYYYLASTLGNATPSDTTLTNYKVTISMGDESYESDAMQGYSVDNINPLAPASLTANFNQVNNVLLDWDPSTDNDFSSFRIYSDEELLVEGITDSHYEDYISNSGNITYEVHTVDNNGNESSPTVITLSIADNFMVQQTVQVEQNKVNYISFNLNTLLSLEDITNQNNEFIYINNDQDEFFVSGENINSDLSTMEILDNSKGYRVLTANNTYNIELEGFIANTEQSIILEPNKMNLLPYLLQDCINSEDIFSDYIDDILIIQDDNGGSYIPSIDINTLGNLCPGNSYSIILSSDETIEFKFNQDVSFSREDENEDTNMIQSSRGNEFNQYINTGQFYPIILSELKGHYNIGDEIVAYAHNNIIGATRILTLDQPIIINAYKKIDMFDIQLDGYEQNETIELYLWKRNNNSKSKLDIDLSENNYGDGQFAVGTATNGYLPKITALKHAYPNPFNPTTNIKFDISKTDMVSIDIYDITGRKVEKLISNVKFVEGQYEVKWHASQYSSGIYFVKLTTSHLVDSHKIILMK